MIKPKSILAIAALVYPFFSSEEISAAPGHHATASTKSSMTAADVFQMLEIPFKKIGDRIVFKTENLVGSGISFFERRSESSTKERSSTDATSAEYNKTTAEEAKKKDRQITALEYIADTLKENSQKLFLFSIALLARMQQGSSASISREMQSKLLENGFGRIRSPIQIDIIFRKALKEEIDKRRKTPREIANKDGMLFQDLKNLLKSCEPSIKVELCPEEKTDLPRRAREEGLNIRDFMEQVSYVQYYLMAMQLFAPNPLSCISDGDFVMKFDLDDRKKMNIRISPLEQRKDIARGQLPRD